MTDRRSKRIPTVDEIAFSSAGTRARRAGVPANANPHAQGTREHDFWLYGWTRQPDFDALEEEADAYFKRYAAAGPVARAYMTGNADADMSLSEDPHPDYTAEEKAAYAQGYLDAEGENDEMPQGRN